MVRTLPPLETFRFFEAAARHLNFTHAAEEMHVTHGAVSQRFKRLEEHLGTPLFRRLMRWLTAPWVTCISSAACVKFKCRAAASKKRNVSSGGSVRTIRK